MFMKGWVRGWRWGGGGEGWRWGVRGGGGDGGDG